MSKADYNLQPVHLMVSMTATCSSAGVIPTLRQDIAEICRENANAKREVVALRDKENAEPCEKIVTLQVELTPYSRWSAALEDRLRLALVQHAVCDRVALQSASTNQYVCETHVHCTYANEGHCLFYIVSLVVKLLCRSMEFVPASNSAQGLYLTETTKKVSSGIIGRCDAVG